LSLSSSFLFIGVQTCVFVNSIIATAECYSKHHNHFHSSTMKAEAPQPLWCLLSNWLHYYTISPVTTYGIITIPNQQLSSSPKQQQYDESHYRTLSIPNFQSST